MIFCLEVQFIQDCDFGGYYVIYVNILKMEVIYVIYFFRGYYVIFLKSGVNSYISLWNAKFIQETLQEFNEKMHCDGRLPQYKTSSRIVTLNNQNLFL